MTEFFSNIKDVLNGVEFRSVKNNYAQIIENWDEIIGKKFSGKANLAQVFQKAGKTFLLVHATSSPIVQELGFFKQHIIKKIHETCGILVSDIIIKPADKQAGREQEQKETEVIEFFDERPTEEELEKIFISDEEISDIKLSVEKQSALTETQKEKMLSVIINDLKTQKWMRDKGFPVCNICGRIMTKKKFGEDNICELCRNNSEESKNENK